METKQKKQNAAWTIGILAIVLVLVIVALLFWPAGGSNGPLLRVQFLDAGDADSILVQPPEGGTLLVDTGLEESWDAIHASLQEAGVEKIDVLVLSHPHADHIGGALSLLEEYQVGEVWTIDIDSTSSLYEEVLAAIETKGVSQKQAKEGESFSLGGVEFRFLAPLTDKSYQEENDKSAVLQFSYGQHTFLLPGDVEKDAEKDLVARYGEALQADVLKVSHHGDDDASAKRFLNTVSPTYAVITGDRNVDSDHVHPETLEKLYKRGIQVFATDENGTVTVTTDGSRLQVQSER